MWIVMTSSAKMANSCWGRYRNVALVRLAPGAEAPKTIRQCGAVIRIEHLGHHFVGATSRCAYERVLADARAEAARRRNG